MAQIPIIQGIYTDQSGDFRTSLPLNYFAVVKDTGISKGYLRPAEGITLWGTGQGVDRGAILWNGVCYRVQGTKLVSISTLGAVTVLGDVGGTGPVTMDYSFDRLMIQSGTALYYYSPSLGFIPVTDPDLGSCLSVRWFAGYTVSTDGSYIVVSDLTDPTTFNPLKYGSSEADPDKIVGLERLRNELYVLNRNTIELFQNIGGTGFPFQRVEGAQIVRGTLGSRTYCIYDEKIAFMGGARNEAIGIYIGVPGEQKISCREVDIILAKYSEADLSKCVLEQRIFNDQKLLYVQLPNQTLVYDIRASEDAGRHIWVSLGSGISGPGQYKGINFVYAYGKWICGSPTSNEFGYLNEAISSHYGQTIGWEFSTQMLYNESKGAIVHRLELVGAPGRTQFGIDPTIWTSYSLDGVKWSQERFIKAGKAGETEKRLVWLQQGSMRQLRAQKFRGTSDAHVSIARLEAELEPLYG